MSVESFTKTWGTLLKVTFPPWQTSTASNSSDSFRPQIPLLPPHWDSYLAGFCGGLVQVITAVVSSCVYTVRHV